MDGKKPFQSQLLMTKEECRQLRSDCSVEKINLALFGEDGRGGIVNDIQEIKSKLNVYSSALRQVAIPIAIAVITAVLVRLLP